MMGPQTNREPLSMAEFGRQKSGLPDDRIREGLAIGVILKLAERLHDLYRLQSLPSKLLEAMAA